MTPEQFIALWKDNKLTERGGAQAHFDDLCELLGVEKPRDPDNYCFERGAHRTGAGHGSRSGQARAQAMGVRMSGGPIWARVEPSTYSTRL